MSFTNDSYLPTYEELNVPPLNLTSPILKAGSVHFGQYCEIQSNEFMLCRAETKDPRKCLEYGKDVSKCASEFFHKVKDNCAESFTDFWKCLDSARNGRMSYKFCTTTQKLFDDCMAEKLNLVRPPVGEMSRVRLYESKRSKPVEKKEFPKLDSPPNPDGPIDPVALDSIKRTEKNRYF